MDIITQNDLGHKLFKEFKYTAAEQVFRELNIEYPNSAKLHRNLAHVLSHELKYDEAVKEYERALAIDKKFFGAAVDLALLKLRLGDLEEGWKLHEARHIFNDKDHQKYIYDNTVPEWQGEDLTGKTITIQPEAGFGDWIMMLRFIPWLVKADKVIVQAHHQLRLLIKESFPEVHFIDLDVIEHGNTKVMRIPKGFETDYRVKIMSLPLRLQMFKEDMIPTTPYLKTNNILDWTQFKDHYAVSWRGNSDNHTDYLRSARVKDFFPLFETGQKFVSIQKDVTPAEEKLLKRFKNVVLLKDDLIDFNDTACVLKSSKGLIAVDTAVVNLAGAMGVKTHLLSAYFGCWRWGINREYSLWYPSVRIWKQDNPNDWSHVVKNVVKEIQAR